MESQISCKDTGHNNSCRHFLIVMVLRSTTGISNECHSQINILCVRKMLKKVNKDVSGCFGNLLFYKQNCEACVFLKALA